MTPRPDGILLVDKPAGVTSHDVVLAARRATGQRRIGHTGTLDPFATGLLVLMIGRATRLLPYVEADPKVYEAGILFGNETDTDDAGGAVARTAQLPARDALVEAASSLTGTVEQMPPAYSAKRVGGRRAYAVAREGGVPALKPVSVRVDSWETLEWQGSFDAVTQWGVRITCGGGTYVRSLARDLARAASSAAHLLTLRRTRSGCFDVANAASLRNLLEHDANVLPPLSAVAHLPRAQLDDANVARVVQGMDIPATTAGDRAALVSATTGDLVAVAVRRDDRWQPRVVMRRADAHATAVGGDDA